MIALLAVATTDLTNTPSPPIEKISAVLKVSPVLWAIGLTLLWDIVDLWIRYRGFFFMKTSAFFIYALFHMLMGLLATIALAKTFDTPWLIGLFAAIANEMVLSNANISFGEASLLPILEKFKELRVAMQEEIDAIKKSKRTELIERLKINLSVEELKNKVSTLLIQTGKQPAVIAAEISKVEEECDNDQNLLATKLANDFIELDSVGAKKAAK